MFAHPTMTEGLKALFMSVPRMVDHAEQPYSRELRIKWKADVANPNAYEGALNAADSLRRHWPEYLMEAGEAGCYLFSACALATLLWHPASPLQTYMRNDAVRRMLMGVGMGATIILIVLSPWGKQSGAHFNPAVTLAFYRLGKVASWDALFYCASQLLGAVGGRGARDAGALGSAGAQSGPL